MIFIWGFILLLAIAVIFLIWAQFTNQGAALSEIQLHQHLEKKVMQLEDNLKKTLEIMQDLAKKMHIQQEVIDKTTTKLNQVESQNAELVGQLAKSIHSTDKPTL
ncbi:MAG: hypothetical protein EON51_07060 [Acinetobacter sp.]|nr:MAG: hypothetical protein EON51_07060 [Acinetobacter sp.]